MIEFYKNKENRTIRPELFSTDAEENLAKRFAGADKKFNKRTQIRKFYDEVVRLNTMAKSNPQDWDNILPYLNMLIAKAVYAEGRELVTHDFVSFIRESVGQVKAPEDLDVFSSLFESFMGFYRKYRPSN
jgi:CRISPR-associated protein Csm2